MSDTNDYGTKPPFLNDAAYAQMKWVALILLPALGTLYWAIASSTGLPAGEQVVGVVMAVDTFLGVVLGISSNQYNKANPVVHAGLIGSNGVDPDTGIPDLQLTVQTHPDEILSSKEVRLKVTQPVSASVPVDPAQ